MENKETPTSASTSTNSSSIQENFILQALNNVHKLILYKLGAAHTASVDDLRQRIFYKIWQWRHRNKKELEFSEWQKLINRTVNSEVSEYFSEKTHREILFSQAEIDFYNQDCLAEHSQNEVNQKLEGNSEAEIRSLLQRIWQAAQSLTIRQRYGFLLYQPDFLIEFVVYGCGTTAEIAAFFELTREELAEIMKKRPLSDEKIAVILATKIKEKISPTVLREARAKAKKKLNKVLQENSFTGLGSVGLLILGGLCSICENLELDNILNLVNRS